MFRKVYWELLRPFTLIAPAVGVVCGATMALGAYQARFSLRTLLCVVGGAIIGSLLNGASNTINQIYDLEIDRMNRPLRPLPSGRVSIKEAWIVAALLVCVSLVGAWFVRPEHGGHAFFWLACAATVTTLFYSAPPVRLKRYWWAANAAIALPRGLLLPVAGWSTVASPFALDPWCMGAVLFLFLLGAASTKDFADVRGDAACGCRTLPVQFGVRRAAAFITPFLIFPFFLLPLWAWLGLMHGGAALGVLGVVLATWGAHVARMILRRPEDLAVENHPSWFHMYLMMMAALIGGAAVYCIYT